MSFISNFKSLFERRGQATLNTPSVPLGGVGFEWAYEMGGGNSTISGEAISNDTAMRVVTVYACIRILSHSIGSLPLLLYEKTASGAKEADAHPLYYLLNTQPNAEMGRHRLWAAIITGLMLDGNAYLQISRNAAGQVAELYPLNPTVTEPFRQDNGTLAFRTQQGQKNGTWKVIPASSICHFALHSLDGLRGLSPIQQAREALGLARAAEKTGAKLFGNGGRPGGILTIPNGLTDEQKVQAKHAWQAANGGSNQGGTAILSEGFAYEPLMLSPSDSQFIELRQMQRAEICALYGVPPSMVGDTSRLSNNNHEQMNLTFVSDTLRPLISIIEDELNRKLMPQVGRKAGAYYAAFDLSERQRGDFVTQMKGYALGKQWGWYSTNDIRRKLGENTIEDPQADVYLYPVNMANAAQLPAQADLINIDEAPPNSNTKDEEDEETQPK